MFINDVKQTQWFARYLNFLRKNEITKQERNKDGTQEGTERISAYRRKESKGRRRKDKMRKKQLMIAGEKNK